MNDVRSVAAAQTIPNRGDVVANLDEHLRLVRAAAEERVRLLVFPELSLTGYELDLAEALAFSENDPRLTPLVEAAAAFDITLVVGAPVRLDAKLFIGAFILAPDRSAHVYTKHRLGAFPAEVNPGGEVPPPEASVFHPGERNPLVHFDGETAAVAVCADIGRPAHAESAAARGANHYLASMFVIPADFDGDMKRLKGYAQQHSMSVVFSNYGGPTGGLPAAGRSAIVSTQGVTLVELPHVGAGLAVAGYAEAARQPKAIAVEM